MITLRLPISPDDQLLRDLISFDQEFEKIQGTNIKAPVDVWEFLLEDVKKPYFMREVNGCGSKSTKFVPDSIWGLQVTAICNIHDVTHKFSKTPEDCDLSNQLFLTNLIKYINNNSHWIIAWLRRYRAMTYYSAVHTARRQFCPGYKNEK